MYVLASHLQKLPVMALQDGRVLAVTAALIIDGHSLNTLALRCKAGRWRSAEAVVLLRDIRQIARDCVLIDSFEDIEDLSEIVRLDRVAADKVKIIGKRVKTEAGKTLGKVEDFSLDSRSGELHKLYVHQSVMKSLLFNNLVIDRTQIVRHDAKTIVVKDAVLGLPHSLVKHAAVKQQPAQP